MKSPCPELQYFGRTKEYDFWFIPDCPVISEAMQLILAGIPDHQQILKQDEKRLVYVGQKKTQPAFIVKINLLPRFKDRLRPQRFAPQECQCHMHIAKNGIPVPRLWGYFRQKRLGITLCNGLVTSFLEDAHNLSIAESEAAIPLLAELHKKGINHPDFMRNNIMLTGPDNHPVLIDLERCSFVAPGDFRLPLMLLARFIEYNANPIQDPQNQFLIQHSYDALTSPPVSRECFQELITMLNTRHLTTRERVGLIVPQEILKKLHQASKS